MQLWMTDDGSSVAVLTEHRAAVVHVAFCLDGVCLASADRDGVVRFRRLSNLLEQ